jgi:hypothetical protein
MRIDQSLWRHGRWSRESANPACQLVLIFSTPALLAQESLWTELRARHPNAQLVACSTAGEILDTHVFDDSLVCTAIEFERSNIATATAQLDESSDCAMLGALLTSRLPRAGLAHVFVLSDGLKVNGSALVAGIVKSLPADIGVTGGLAGDGARFEQTAVCVNGPRPREQVAAIGFYGSGLRIGYGSLGGWDSFGVERRITRAESNVLFELDGEPALDLYKRYLGEHASSLPASGLLFPLSIRTGSEDMTPVVRTILSVDERARTMTFAGDVPVGYRARLMRANFERLLDGASGAARATQDSLGQGSPELAILISCVGRKLVLRQRIEEEVEAVRDVLGPTTWLSGFYSYGEISPFTPSARCELHNQTMTITTLSES